MKITVFKNRIVETERVAAIAKKDAAKFFPRMPTDRLRAIKYLYGQKSRRTRAWQRFVGAAAWKEVEVHRPSPRFKFFVTVDGKGVRAIEEEYDVSGLGSEEEIEQKLAELERISEAA
jgi:hypothetical protein